MYMQAENITKAYREKPLLDGVSLYLNEGDKVGVIGVNGTGKSTLLKILAGWEESDGGTITRGNGVRIGYLPQNPDFEEHTTVLEQVFKGNHLAEQEQREYEAKSILNRLGITEFDRDVTTLSGGQKKRVAIASALMTPCEVLILDEPTNHIDSEMVLWLETYLQRYKGALVMITHDRYFLDRVVNKIVEIDRGKLYTYESNYTKFLELKAMREESALASERKRQSLLRTELAWVQRGVRARGTKSRSRLERYEELKNREAPEEVQKLNLSSLSTRLGKKIVEAEHISKRFGDRVVVQDFSCLITRDARIGIIGANGCGKSTLLKMLFGTLQPDSGTVTVGETVRYGYFSQECEEMDTSLRVIDYIRDVAAYIDTADGRLTASQMLEKFLFPADLQWNTIGRLSGGERRRLFLLRILMEAPNVLLLDEPTNDLDIQTLLILEEFLESFQGAVLVVSHDRYFLDKVVDSVFAFEGGGVIRQYLGGYTDYAEQHQASVQEQEAPKASVKVSKERVKTPRKLKFSFREQYEFDHIDEEIAALEEKLQTLDAEIAAQSSNFEKLNELLAQKEEVDRQLEEKTERWVYLNELAEKIEQQNT